MKMPAHDRIVGGIVYAVLFLLAILIGCDKEDENCEAYTFYGPMCGDDKDCLYWYPDGGWYCDTDDPIESNSCGDVVYTCEKNNGDE